MTIDDTCAADGVFSRGEGRAGVLRPAMDHQSALRLPGCRLPGEINCS